MQRKRISTQNKSMRLFKDLSWGTAMFISTALLIAAFILFFSYTGCVLNNKQPTPVEDKTVKVNDHDTVY